MSKVLIIDDSDPAITYTGNWATLSIVGVLTGEYNTTTHQSSAAGNQLLYTFEGTSVAVYGSLDSPNLNGPPSAAFSIDGQTPTAFNSSNNIFVVNPNVVTSYAQLYKSPALTKGTHTLYISSGTPANPAARLYIDFLTVDTGSDSASGTIIVDDRDDAIQYTGNWANGGVLWEYGITSKGSPDSVPGGTATFHFNGTDITVYGTTYPSLGPNTTSIISFALDGGFNTRFNGPQQSGLTEHTPMFQAKGLSGDQEHSLIITSINTNRWSLDCITYNTQNSAITGGGAAVGGGGGGGGSVGDGRSGGGPSVGATVGAAVAGIATGLAIAGIIFLLLRWRKLKSNEEPDKSVVVGTETHFDPSLEPSRFTPPTMGPHMHANPLPNKQYGSNNLSGSALTGGAGERVGRALLDSTASSSYLGTQFPSSNLTPGMSQYSDGESQHIISAAQGPSHGNARHNLHSQPYPSFDPGPGGGVDSMYERDNRHEYNQLSGGQKAVYMHGLPVPPITQAVARQPPSTVRTVEEDSGIRIPARSPPVYTPE